MKKVLACLLFVSGMVTSCDYEGEEVDQINVQAELQNACSAEDPLEMDWVQELISGLNCGDYACEVAILKSQYEGETVFYIQMIDPLCYGFEKIDLYDCSGEKIKEFTLEESREFVNHPEHEAESIFSCNV
ncbi:hypothetical protein RM549_00045 [Salegentibacter sp. F188]|uniref:Lipoprotein n=1 Tax=Autumnicola patrickiae TaxID=3075591 RepID=A0ABU3DWR7_9FLAO|nr:hypothetical protein [Salegentibacter sp. F188]MDT0688157.1 hypothetical protein [Salegentibacter sp. F188]